MLRDGESSFLSNLEVSKRGFVKVAASQVPGRISKIEKDPTKVLKKQIGDAQEALKTLKKNPGLVKVIQNADVDNIEKIAQDIFEELKKELGKTNEIEIKTAKTLRQAGIFKFAGRDVYEDLETGDFWKISEDKQHVIRLFKEDEKGIADKRA